MLPDQEAVSLNQPKHNSQQSYKGNSSRILFLIKVRGQHERKLKGERIQSHVVKTFRKEFKTVKAKEGC